MKLWGRPSSSLIPPGWLTMDPQRTERPLLEGPRVSHSLGFRSSLAAAALTSASSQERLRSCQKWPGPVPPASS